MYYIQYYKNGEWHLYTICPEVVVEWELAELAYNRNLGRADTRAVYHQHLTCIEQPCYL